MKLNASAQNGVGSKESTAQERPSAVQLKCAAWLGTPAAPAARAAPAAAARPAAAAAAPTLPVPAAAAGPPATAAAATAVACIDARGAADQAASRSRLSHAALHSKGGPWERQEHAVRCLQPCMNAAAHAHVRWYHAPPHLSSCSSSEPGSPRQSAPLLPPADHGAVTEGGGWSPCRRRRRRQASTPCPLLARSPHASLAALHIAQTLATQPQLAGPQRTCSSRLMSQGSWMRRAGTPFSSGTQVRM